MSTLDDFFASGTLKITNITGNLHIPFGGVQTLSRMNFCAEKHWDSFEVTIMASQLIEGVDPDFPITFGTLNILDRAEDWAIIRFRANQTFDQPLQVPGAPRVQLRTVAGDVTVVMRTIAAQDEPDCDMNLRRYNVSLEPRIDEPNFIQIGVDYGIWGRFNILDDNIQVHAVAGYNIPPTPPEPLSLTSVSLAVRRSCALIFPRRILGSVLLNREVVFSDGDTRVYLEARGGRGVFVIPWRLSIRPGSRRATFQVRTPHGFTGQVTVTAQFQGESPRVVDVDVLDGDDPFCLAPEMYFLAERLRVPYFPCPDLYFNEIGDLAGSHDGWAFRRHAGGGLLSYRDGLGGEVRRLAMNAFAEATGSTVDASGGLHGFVIPSGDSTPAIVLDDVQFNAINDDGLAVGYRRAKGQDEAFAFALIEPKSSSVRSKGKRVSLPAIKAARSEAVAVNNLGQIVVVADVGAPKMFLLETVGREKRVTDLGEISKTGTIRKFTDSGFLLGNELVDAEGFRPFLIWLGAKQVNREPIPVLEGFDHVVAHDVDEQGMVIGRALKDKEADSRGFRFTKSRGVEDLNKLSKLEDGSVITAGVSANQRGEIVVEVARGAEVSYEILVPKR